MRPMIGSLFIHLLCHPIPPDLREAADVVRCQPIEFANRTQRLFFYLN